MPPSNGRLVGRAAEFAQVIEAMSAAQGGHPATVLMSGEAGIGKTRLTEDVVKWARAHGIAVVSGHCAPVSGTRLPFGPVVDLLLDLRRLHPDLPESVPAEVWRGVSQLTGGVEQPMGISPNLSSTRLFAAFSAILTAVSARHSAVLVVVEDLHWSDPASADLFGFVARALRHANILLLITHRPTDEQRRSPVRAALAEIARLPCTETVSLAPLSAAAVGEILDDLSLALEPARRSKIAELSAGVPFFALHLAAHDDDGAVPPRLRDVLMSSVDGLSAEERQLLILLAVMGDVEDSEFCRAAGLSPEDYMCLLRPLVDGGLVVVRGGSTGFRHALLRDVVVEDILPSERVVAHALIADALLSSSAGQQSAQASRLAYHLLEAGRHADAIRYAVSGARQASAMWAFTDARRLYATVRRLWPLVDDPAARGGLSYPRLLQESAIANRWCGELDAALRLFEEAERLPDLTAAVRAEMEHARGQVLWARGDMGDSLAAYRRADALLPAHTNDQLRAAVAASLAHGLMATGQARDALTMAQTAADLALAAGADRERIHALITAAAARAQLGDVDEAVAALRDCLPDARRLDDLELVLRCYGNLAYAHGVACRYDEVAATADEGIKVCLRYGPIVSVASTLAGNLVGALIALGRWDEALQVAGDALNEVTSAGVAMHLRALMAEVAVSRGDTDEVERYLTEFRQRRTDNLYTSLETLAAEHALWQHDPRVAAECISHVLPCRLAQDDALPVLTACYLGLRAEADIAEADIPRRRSGPVSPLPGELRDTARAARASTTLPVASALLLECEAEADRVTGTDTVEQWTAAADANARLKRPYPRAYCLLRLGAAHLRGQARSAAARCLGEAQQTAENLGARPLLGEIRTLIAVSNLRIVATTTEAPVDGKAERPYGLTHREQQILAHLTSGATNRQIARSLFISERTASVHVSNILGKLGAANRTEAARIAVRLKLDITGS